MSNHGLVMMTERESGSQQVSAMAEDLGANLAHLADQQFLEQSKYVSPGHASA
jgi:hypothetical protein